MWITLFWKVSASFSSIYQKTQELQLFKVQKISMHLYCRRHVGRQMSAYQPIFPCNIIETSPTSLACNSVFIGPNLVQRHVVWSYRLYQNLGQIDHNLHSYVFDDVICKPPIVADSNIWWLTQNKEDALHRMIMSEAATWFAFFA